MKSPIKSKTCLRLSFKFFAITLFLFSTFPSFAQNDKLMQKVLIEPGENLMPMMQFSVAPWRVLDAEHLKAVQKSIAVRT
jgi:hypothetical protein